MAVRAAHSSAYEEEGRFALRTWLRLLASANIIEGRIRGQLRRNFETTLPRFDVLAQLDAAENSGRGLTMSELSHRLMVTNGNVTGLVDRLAREGLVTRSVAHNDRRTQVVRLTSAGRRFFNRMVPEHRAWVEQIFAALKHDEHTQLYALLGKLKEAVERTSREEDQP